MTAPVGDDLTWLDDLQRAHAAATRGAWEHVVDDHGPRKGVEHSVWDDVATRYIVETLAEADAALIVAAVNAVPTLIAELRKRDAALRARGGPCPTCVREGGPYRCCPCCADDPGAHEDGQRNHHDLPCSTCVTAALTPESVPT